MDLQDYALQVISANEQKKKFHKTDLPKALTTAQEIYVAVTHETKESVAGYAEGLLRASAALTAIQQALLAKAEAISGEAAIGVVMSTLSIDVNAPGWTEVQFVSPETGDTGPARLQVSDAESVAVLEKRLANLERITTQLATDMSKQVKSVDGIEKLYNQYLSTPSFGSPDDVFESKFGKRLGLFSVFFWFVLPCLGRFQFGPGCPPFPAFVSVFLFFYLSLSSLLSLPPPLSPTHARGCLVVWLSGCLTWRSPRDVLPHRPRRKSCTWRRNRCATF